MRIKQRLDDFRVRELLAEGFLQERGEQRVYRVTKRKLTSLQAARELAYVAGVSAADVALAGLKDRQGVTIQYMSIRRGREVSLRALDLTVESVGFAAEPISSQDSLGNAFEVTLRGLTQPELDVLRDNVPALRECGVINYFDEQRFGNLRHNQGWIAQQLMRGDHEGALKRLLASLSDHDDRESQAFKHALLAAWGDWNVCRDIAGRFGQHHSVFEYLKRNDGDFAGAFYHVSSRLRLIHLYAFQSHLWNRAVAEFTRKLVPLEERVVLEGVEGPLVYPSRPLPLPPGASFRLPGAGLEDVSDPDQRRWLEDALARERMVASDFRIDGVPGFQLKGEERELILEPRHLRVRPPERDQLNFGAFAVKVRFELPRGAYATLVVRRLLSTPLESAGRERGADRGQRDTRPQRFEAGQRDQGAGPRREDQRGHERGEQRDRQESAGDRGGSRGRSDARPQRRQAPPQHSESGQSLAPPRRDDYGRGDRDRHRGRGGWQNPSNQEWRQPDGGAGRAFSHGEQRDRPRWRARKERPEWGGQPGRSDAGRQTQRAPYGRGPDRGTQQGGGYPSRGRGFAPREQPGAWSERPDGERERRPDFGARPQPGGPEGHREPDAPRQGHGSHRHWQDRGVLGLRSDGVGSERGGQGSRRGWNRGERGEHGGRGAGENQGRGNFGRDRSQPSDANPRERSRGEQSQHDDS